MKLTFNVDAALFTPCLWAFQTTVFWTNTTTMDTSYSVWLISPIINITSLLVLFFPYCSIVCRSSKRNLLWCSRLKSIWRCRRNTVVAFDVVFSKNIHSFRAATTVSFWQTRDIFSSHNFFSIQHKRRHHLPIAKLVRHIVDKVLMHFLTSKEVLENGIFMFSWLSKV